MKKMKKAELSEIVNSDDFELLDPNSLDDVLGGLSCKQNYSYNGGTTKCGCGYNSSGS